MTGLLGGAALLLGLLAGCGGAERVDAEVHETPGTEEASPEQQVAGATVWDCEEKNMTPCSTPGARRECYWDGVAEPGICFCNIKGDWLCG